MQITNIQTLTNQAENHLLKGLPTNYKTGSKTDNLPIDRLKVAQFWRRMSEIFTYKWTKTNGEKPVNGSMWIDFINSLIQDDIEKGLKAILDTFSPDAWPPSIIEFKNLCNGITPKALGLPDLDTAFNQALAGKFKLNEIHDVVIAAANQTGIFDLRRGVPTDIELKKRFAYNYHIIVDRFAKGEPLNGEVNKGLEHLVNSPTTGCNDALIDEAIQTQRASGLSGREWFLEAKKNLRGVR